MFVSKEEYVFIGLSASKQLEVIEKSKDIRREKKFFAIYTQAEEQETSVTHGWIHISYYSKWEWRQKLIDNGSEWASEKEKKAREKIDRARMFTYVKPSIWLMTEKNLQLVEVAAEIIIKKFWLSRMWPNFYYADMAPDFVANWVAMNYIYLFLNGVNDTSLAASLAKRVEFHEKDQLWKFVFY